MSDVEEEANAGGSGKKGGGGGKNHNKYRKDKPWDSASIDHWSIPDWKDETMKVGGRRWMVCSLACPQDQCVT